MGLPSGNFSAPVDGRLQVTFSGQWRRGSGDIVGGSGWQLRLAGYVGSGETRLVTVLSFEASSAVIELPYSASTVVPVGMELVSFSWGGAGTVQATKLRIVCRLFSVT